MFSNTNCLPVILSMFVMLLPSTIIAVISTSRQSLKRLVDSGQVHPLYHTTQWKCPCRARGVPQSHPSPLVHPDALD
jgi:hypothetical protein